MKQSHMRKLLTTAAWKGHMKKKSYSDELAICSDEQAICSDELGLIRTNKDCFGQIRICSNELAICLDE